MTNLHSILKSRDITLLRKVRIGKTMAFQVVIYGCESWTTKKAEHQRIYALELWCWRRLLRVPWTSRSNPLILKEIHPKYSLEGLMLKLKLQYFGHLLQRTDSLEKTLMLGKMEGRRRRGQQRMRCWMASLTQWIWVWAPPGVGDGQGGLACCSPWGHRFRTTELTELKMDLEGMMLCEKSQTEKDKYFMISLMWTQKKQI